MDSPNILNKIDILIVIEFFFHPSSKKCPKAKVILETYIMQADQIEKNMKSAFLYEYNIECNDYQSP